jgi:RNA polymerase sigma factor (sigma-70 family)
MATKGLRKALDHLREALPSGLSDASLLTRFLAERDEAAFAALVRRHGPMVMGVCRRILGHAHDAEDVFQATFLVLAQKARSVLNRQALPSWLYMVAFRTSLHAKKRNARRQRKETQVENMPHAELAAPEPQDWHAVLDRELSSLPEKYRLPVILCDLEGRMRREAARQLGIAEGTLASRLATARRMLAKRLAGHGIGLSAGALATALAAQAAVSVAPPLVSATARAAALVSAGQLGTISTSVTLLMKGARTAMYLSKLKTLATVLVVVVLGAGTLFYGAGAAQPPASGGGSGGGERGKPRSELEALREENELLKVNLRATLERIRTLEKEGEAKKAPALDANKAQNNYANDYASLKRALLDAKKLQEKYANPFEVIEDALAQKKIDWLFPGADPQNREARRAAETLRDAARQMRKRHARGF